jgi:hypothetical protein
MLVFAAPATAITFGQLDGDGHPNVGAMIVPDADGNPDVWCTGTLVSPTVFVTASHCTIDLTTTGHEHDVYVSFDSVIGDAPSLHRGTAHTNPLYGHDQHDPGDVAVIVLDEPVVGITPAHLPTADLLGGLDLKAQRFVAVGYGTVREDKTKGGQSIFWDGARRAVDQGFRSLTKAWLNLSMNPSIGSGGTCYGDSGGPHFLGSTDIVVAVTVTGDAWCRSTDVDYRLDTPASRTFLGQFVSLP